MNVPYLVSQWFLLGVLVLELGAKVALNWGHQMGIVEDHELYDEISQNQRGTALAVSSLVFAGIALLLSSEPTQYVAQIELLVVAFGLLLTAAFAHELTLTYRVVLTFQEMALEYGLLILLYALARLVQMFVPEAGTVAFVVFGLVLVFRFVSVKGEIEAHQSTGTGGGDGDDVEEEEE